MAVAVADRILRSTSALLFLLLLCGPAVAAQSNYPIINSGVAEHLRDEPQLHWLDERTLFFTGYAENQRRLFLWTVGDKPRVHPTPGWDAAQTDYCAANGKIRYAVAPGKGERRWRSGVPGSETLEELTPRPASVANAPKDSAIPVNKVGVPCGGVEDARMRGRSWATDAVRGFYLDFGPVQEAVDPTRDPVVLMTAERTGSVRLPIRHDQVVPECTQYIRHLEAFLIWDCNFAAKRVQAEWKRAGCWPFWQVWPPQGHVEKGCIPHGKWADTGHPLLPTQLGFYFVSTRYDDGASLKEPGSAGLYRVYAGTATRVVPGMLLKPSVSPDGCLIAFTYAPNYHAMARQSPARLSVAAVDVCRTARR